MPINCLRVCTFIFLLIPKMVLAATLPLMPYPKSVVVNSENQIALTPGFSVSFHDNSVVTDRLRLAAARTESRYFRQTGLPQVSPILPDKQSQLFVHVNRHAELPLSSQTDEAYLLTVSEQGLLLRADTDIGAIRGMETFLQLVTHTSGQFTLPDITIEDSPEFSWRGLMLDSSRHFIQIATIERLLHVMASAKLNVLHWHLADDQGWRLPIADYPALHNSASDNQFYTHEQVRQVVHLADQLGIRVIPELDFPGHASAIAVAYPQLMSRASHYTMQRSWGVHRPLLDPTNEKVYDFIAACIAQLAQLFPDPYVHIGGDEVDPRDWMNTPHIKNFMAKKGFEDAHEVQAFFNQRVSKILSQHGKSMIGWDEVSHDSLPMDVVIQSWRGYDSIVESVKAGRPVILSTGFYVDQPQYTEYHWGNSIVPEATPIASLTATRHFKFEINRLRGSAIQASLSIGENKMKGIIKL